MLKLVRLQEVNIIVPPCEVFQREDGNYDYRREGETKVEESGPFLLNPEHVTSLEEPCEFERGDERRNRYTCISVLDQGDTIVLGSIGEVAERLCSK